MKLDPSILDLKKMEPGSHDEYGIDVMRYGINVDLQHRKILRRRRAQARERPARDLKRFPGKRCLFNTIRSSAASSRSALLAAGDAARHAYPLDLDRASAELDKIKIRHPVVEQWRHEAIRLLSSGANAPSGIA